MIFYNRCFFGISGLTQNILDWVTALTTCVGGFFMPCCSFKILHVWYKVLLVEHRVLYEVKEQVLFS